MVRRWAYINQKFLYFSFEKSFFFTQKKYKLINFKTSVSLKRFNKKYTKFKRKALNRIKHIRNWTIFHNIFKNWSQDFLFFKKLYKNDFLKKILPYSFCFYNIFFIKKLISVVHSSSFLFFNLPKKTFFYTINNYFKINETTKNYISRNQSFQLKEKKNFFLSQFTTDNLTLISNTNNSFLFFYCDYPVLMLPQFSHNNIKKNSSVFNKNFINFYIYKFKLLILYYQFVLNLVILNTHF